MRQPQSRNRPRRHPALRLAQALAGVCLLAVGTVRADNDLAFYHAEVEPILEAHCLRCHGAGERLRGGLYLTHRDGLLQGGDRGPAVDLADPDASLFLAMISYRDELHEMPPAGKLPDADIATLAEWIRLGAPMPEESPFAPIGEEAHTAYRTEVNEETRNWWAYRPVARPPVPAVADPAWGENPVDAFIRAGLDAAGLRPPAEADRRTLMRRVHYNLLGLPPSPAEIEAFVADPDPDAYAKLVDRLLDSPHYGEKWGRHWLDLVRYAETNGFERDNPKPHIWRYRDYVINAFNTDKPYDRFIREQIAGDELPDGGVEGIVATGFYRLGIWDDEPVDKLEGRYDTLDGVIATTTEVFLATTMACARCHDHKIDPIPQRDYFRMLAFIDNVTDMHTTNITRSILAGEARAEFEERVRGREADIARLDRRVKRMESDFLEAYAARHPEVRGNAHAPDMRGVRYRYFRDTWDRLPDFDQIKHEDEGVLEHGFFDLAVRTRDEAFGFVFEGDLQVPERGEHTFLLDADDGARLSVGGRVLLELDGRNALGYPREATVALDAGNHAIRVDYFQHAGPLGLRLAWSGPGFARRNLSQERPSLDLPALIAANGDTLLGAPFARRYAEQRARAESLRREEVPGGEYAACVAEFGATPPTTHVHFRGNPNVSGDPVEPGFPEVLGLPDPAPPAPPPDAESTGRRRVLADWIASPENPLTARVMANRLWQYHFGRGLTRTPNDFGQAGERPTHPELLDWLAAELVEGGWTLKRMHRLLLNARAYRASSAFDAENHARDANNDHFWRFDMRRLGAEELRDSILAVNGAINLAMGGPSVFPPLPEAVLQTSSMPGQAWREAPPEDHTRRSVYIHVKRSLLTPLLTDFDLADTDNSCPVRFSTILPTQALNLLNSEFVHEQAARFARRLETEADARDARVRRAFHLATGRVPTDAEVGRALEFLDDMARDHGLDEARALDRFALLVLNLNEFVFLD